MKREGPTAEELQKVKAGLELRAISRLQSNLAKANILNEGSVFHDDPGYFQKDLASTQAVTAADVRRVANKYLGATAASSSASSPWASWTWRPSPTRAPT